MRDVISINSIACLTIALVTSCWAGFRLFPTLIGAVFHHAGPVYRQPGHPCDTSLDPDVPRRGMLVLTPGDLGFSTRSVDLVDKVSGEALTLSQTLPVHLDHGWNVAAIYTSPAPLPLRSTCEH